MRSVLENESARLPFHLAIHEVDYPSAAPSEALVRVKAVSLNRGEVRMAFHAEAALRPGWDLAGIVEIAHFELEEMRGSSTCATSSAQATRALHLTLAAR